MVSGPEGWNLCRPNGSVALRSQRRKPVGGAPASDQNGSGTPVACSALTVWISTELIAALIKGNFWNCTAPISSNNAQVGAYVLKESHKPRDLASTSWR